MPCGHAVTAACILWMSAAACLVLRIWNFRFGTTCSQLPATSYVPAMERCACNGAMRLWLWRGFVVVAGRCACDGALHQRGRDVSEGIRGGSRCGGDGALRL